MAPDITLENVYTDLRAFLLAVLEAPVEVIQGLGNRVPQPLGDHVVMTASFQGRLSTNIHTYDDPFPVVPGELAIEMKTRVDIQLDCYGANSASMATVLMAVLRDPVACEALAPTCQPLYCDEARLIPLVTGEEQYLERWSLTGVLQYNPVITTPQQFAGAATVELVNVDVEYPP